MGWVGGRVLGEWGGGGGGFIMIVEDGELYTHEEFMAYYGPYCGAIRWSVVPLLLLISIVPLLLLLSIV